MRPIAYSNLALEAFPLLIEALHYKTREVVWSRVVAPPTEASPRAVVDVPPLRKELGFPVAMRLTFATGYVDTREPMIKCPQCGMISDRLKDVLREYCPECEQLHADMAPDEWEEGQ